MQMESIPLDCSSWKKTHIRRWLLEDVEIAEEYVDVLIKRGLTKRSLKRFLSEPTAFEEEFGEVPRSIRRNIVDAWRERVECKPYQDQTITKPASNDRKRSQSPTQMKYGKSHSTFQGCLSPKAQESERTQHKVDSRKGKMSRKHSEDNPVSLEEDQEKPTYSLPELFREFDTDEKCTYSRKCQFLPETGPDDLLNPCHEYKAFQSETSSDITKQINFIKYLVKFACACLNERTNGTIHFGVGDDKEKDDSGKTKFKHGEVLGISIDVKKDHQNFYEWTERAIKSCFKVCSASGKSVSGLERDILKCIRRPKFVSVDPPNERNLCVVEIDIVPESSLCSDYHFKVSAPTSAKKGGNINFSENKFQIYRRFGSSSEPLCKKEEIKSFTHNEVQKLNKLRKDAEEKRSFKKIPKQELLENEKKLTKFLLNGHRSINDVYPIVVCSGHDDKTVPEQDLSFVAQLDCTVVFDFDVDSEKDGLSRVCKSSFNQRKFKKSIRLYDIDNDVFTTKDSSDKFCEKLNFKKDVVWVYPNGHSKYSSNGNCAQPATAMSLSEWTEKRSRKMSDAIFMLSNPGVMPEGRASIMCILMKCDQEQMKIICECIQSLITRFEMDNLFFLIRDERVKELFFRLIGAGDRYPKQNLEKRIIVGMPWSQVNQAIVYLRGYVPSNNCVVRYSNGGLCEIDVDTQRKLENCVIVSLKQCSDKHLQNNEQFRQQEEEKFFNGGKVNWWNFFFPGQVCRRDLVDDYYYRIYRAAFQQMEEYVHLIKLRHERGAGGSTVARNLLWDLRKFFRCVEITNLDKEETDETAEQIVELFAYGEEDPSKCLPVLALLDLECEEEIVNELKSDFEELFHGKGARTPACILLHCLSQQTTNEPDLKQELSEKELQWFENKEKEMQQSVSSSESGVDKRGLTIDKSLNTMLGFQVLRNNFNYDRIKDIVCGLAEKTSSKENDLLQFLALIQVYVNECIPLPCCDNMMGPQWQKQISKEFEQLTIWYSGTVSSNQSIVSGVTYLTTRHYFVSKSILESKKLSQVTSKFLLSNLLKSGSHSRKILCQSTMTMMKQRKETPEKQNLPASKQRFSELITDIVDKESPSVAADLLQDCFDILKVVNLDPFLLQQAARVYYLKIFDFHEALILAEKAISYNTNNSYLLDTKGQVFKEKLRYNFPVSRDKHFSVEDGSRIIELSFTALDVFQQSIVAAKAEYQASPPVRRRRRRLNYSGFYGSFYVAYDLLERLSQVEEFNIDVVKKYLSDHNYIPSNVKRPWHKHHVRMKQIELAVNRVMEELADHNLNANLFEEMPTIIDMRNKSYNDMKIRYKKYFGTLPFITENVYTNQHISDECENRRREIRAIAITVCSRTGHEIHDNRSSAKVLGFASVFDLFQWFWVYYGKKDDISRFAINKLTKAKNVLERNSPKAKYDLQMLIYINLLLANFEVDGTDEFQFYKETFDYCKEYFDKSKSDDNLYSSILIAMLMWPRENMPCKYNNSLFLEALARIKTIRNAEVIQDSVQFYLGKGKGLQAFIHAKKLSQGSKYRLDRDRFWTEKSVQEKVFRVRGYSNQVNKILANNICKKSEPVLVHCKKVLERYSQEEGTFVLGFRKSGPIAFDWQETKPNSPRVKRLVKTVTRR